MITYADVETIARELEQNWEIPTLLTDPLGNPKIAKGVPYGYWPAILHLSPARLAGFEVCASRTPGCTAACLNVSGRGARMEGVHVARLKRTLYFKRDRAGFMIKLEREIARHVRRARAIGLEPCVRLNGTSDLPWEAVRYVGVDGTRGTILERFPDVQFYDYTKHAHRFARPRPDNYDLTFSLADGNETHADEAMANGARVAVVLRNRTQPNARYWQLPTLWNGVRVIDADKTDLRFLDPDAVYCGLRAKGPAIRDTSGFVHDVTPAQTLEPIAVDPREWATL